MTCLGIENTAISDRVKESVEFWWSKRPWNKKGQTLNAA